ncbi:MAG TPA: hypothetical protein VNV60_01920 [Holophagaceae bacterium]|jgi:hypothetical protein|nr:hypothetical protein [Holophagaceae bacterium]
MTADHLKKKYVLVIGLLLILSLYVAATRVYQVDEAQNIYESWLMGTGRSGHYDLYAPIYLFALQFVTRLGSSAEAMYLSARLVWVATFWSILVLIARCTGSSWKEERFWKALVIAGFTAPIWTYGLEVRHDGPALILMLAIWLLVNPRKALWRYGHLLAGSLLAVLFFCSSKHILYVAPLFLLVLFVPHPLDSTSRSRRMLHTGLGLLGGLVLFVTLHLAEGSLGQVLREFRALYSGVGGAERFGPWALFKTVIQQSPLVLLFGALPFLLLGRDSLRGWIRNAWTNGVAELIFMGSVLLGVLLNPVPFPYNSLPLAGIALATGLPAFLRWLEDQAPRSPGWAIGHGAILFALCLPWTVQFARLLEMDNGRQVELMNLAERFTGPGDRVFDAAGLVPGRDSLQPTWFVHLGNAQALQSDPARKIETLVRANPPAVLIPTYRMSYLDADAQSFLEGHYFPLAEDFWVLGKSQPAPGGEWECLLSGHYWVGVGQGGASIDGQPMETGAHDFVKGSHSISAPAGSGATILWLGPNLSAPPSLGKGSPGVFPIPIQM